ncbi:MAG: tRNA 4-thiouridine(8) synthase ThiI [Clostridia bacterium]|nr:tRNA 4-thiouridine(8) synthase ThiI [Clostridia bacterium]
MKEIILAKCGEIVLKGLNRRHFESMLLRQTRGALKRYGEFDVTTKQSTVYIEPLEEVADMDEVVDKISRIFGFVKISRAVVADKNIEDMKAQAAAHIAPRLAGYKTFKVESKRSDKRFPMTSLEISREVGGAILSACPHLRVDVHNPDIIVHAEVREAAAYIHAGQIDAAGGMPYGSAGKGVLLLSGGIDSPVAAHMIAKRGVQIVPLHFFSPPYTGERAKMKVIKLAQILTDFCPGMRLRVVHFTEIQKAILENCREELFTVIMRRFMMRVAYAVMKSTKAECLITGESLGQVASQTLQAIGITDATVPAVTLRPCIGMDKDEIVKISRKIGTFETSIEPYEDCCTVFTPKHPKTRPFIDEIEREEAKLDIDVLVQRATENIEIIDL